MELTIALVAIAGLLISVGVIGTLRAMKDAKSWQKECLKQRLRYWT